MIVILTGLLSFFTRGIGLHFIGRNFSAAMDDQTVAPIGFSITFPGLLSLATGMGLEFPIGQTDIDSVLHLREVELKRFV